VRQIADYVRVSVMGRSTRKSFGLAYYDVVYSRTWIPTSWRDFASRLLTWRWKQYVLCHRH